MQGALTQLSPSATEGGGTAQEERRRQFGVPLGDLRKLAERIKTDHQLALALWDTGNLDARLLAILLG